MDAGVAAVLGATVGVVGTLGTAVFTYAAARRQARDAGVVEHGHWLRERRHERYIAFLDGLGAWDTVLDQVWEPLGNYRRDPAAGRADLLAVLRALEDRYDDLVALEERVALVGPSGAAHAAEHTRRTYRVLFDVIHHAATERQPIPETEVEATLGHAQEVAGEFRKVSRKVIETPPGVQKRL
ncbi:MULTISPECIES: hypothetical protein [unclassified Streptomyces]|uniref:hypothetical protein n=1 Tax=unclassified Streptomyces TaxID=2593676 RepID=UPI000B50F7E1|nr:MULTISPECIES: hypothetical protein [unclassified Streptomyces]MYW99882.1 hypothetical protein [Streptomyces sp. SID8378]SNB89849.1 hypothetical protein SAMN02745831_06143 [Streptomyces sp. PgraA7]